VDGVVVAGHADGGDAVRVEAATKGRRGDGRLAGPPGSKGRNGQVAERWVPPTIDYSLTNKWVPQAVAIV
jgi:hypothetical protein